MSAPAEIATAEQAPEPASEQVDLFHACAELIATQEAMLEHDGARSGPEWLAKTQAYREAWARLQAVFRQIKGGEA